MEHEYNETYSGEEQYSQTFQMLQLVMKFWENTFFFSIFLEFPLQFPNKGY